jgi:hypothetical protein
VILAVAALLAGCAGLGQLDKPPRVTLAGLEPVQVELLEQRFVAVLRVQNPNPVALPIDGLEYTLAINGSDFAEGVSSQRITVPAYGEKTLEVGVRWRSGWSAASCHCSASSSSCRAPTGGCATRSAAPSAFAAPAWCPSSTRGRWTCDHRGAAPPGEPSDDTGDARAPARGP